MIRGLSFAFQSLGEVPSLKLDRNDWYHAKGKKPARMKLSCTAQVIWQNVRIVVLFCGRGRDGSSGFCKRFFDHGWVPHPFNFPRFPNDEGCRDIHLVRGGHVIPRHGLLSVRCETVLNLIGPS